jgi:1-acyl-sn-glycerol-3-phosphate acyltransferase
VIKAFLVGLIKIICGTTVRWIESPQMAGQCIYFANHTSHFDVVVLWAALPGEVRAKTRPVAAKEYWEASNLRRYLAAKVFHAILIDRTKVSVQNNPIKLMINEMGDSYSLIIFPEGGRSSGDDVGQFKSGLYHLARENPKAKLVPVFIDNMNRILPKGEFLPVPMLSCISFGAPIVLALNENKADFLERARKAICNLKQI